MIAHRTFSVVLLASLMLSVAPVMAQKPYRGAEYRTIATMTYGRFEVRMRSAPVSGMLSSFFTYYDPANPWNEIDIEIMGRYTNEAQFNTIVPTQADNHVLRYVMNVNPHAAFHVYAFEWTPDYVAWLIDGDEVYRQTGAHIAKITNPQKLMMNMWQPSAVDWAGTFDSAQLPVYAYYDWVKYYAYSPGTGDNFTLQWTDDFNSFDTQRWQKATHTWDGNNAQFVTDNAVLQGGYLILCLTSNTTSGYSGGAIVDRDVDPPFPVSAYAFDSTIVVRFSEPVSAATAEDVSRYSGGSVIYKGARLRSDQRTVDIAVGGMSLTTPFTLSVRDIQDLASPANTMGVKTIGVTMPLQFPVWIDVGGSGGGGYLADSVWNGRASYGSVGGTKNSVASYIPIANTTDPAPYRSALHGLSEYKIRVPNGEYKVTLMMAELRKNAAGQRVFSCKVEGDSIFTNLDLFQTAGLLGAYDVVAPSVKVNDNILDLWFGAATDSTSLSGIKVDRIAGPTGLRVQPAEIPAWTFTVFPNPTNASAVFRYSVPAAESLAFIVHDLVGRRVADIDLGHVPAGVHEYHWAAERLASGTYYCTMKGDSYSVTRKIVIIK